MSDPTSAGWIAFETTSFEAVGPFQTEVQALAWIENNHPEADEDDDFWVQLQVKRPKGD